MMLHHTRQAQKRNWHLWIAVAVLSLLAWCQAEDDPAAPLTYHQGDAP
jgi:nicotinamide riboside transporter PnuC